MESYSEVLEARTFIYDFFGDRVQARTVVGMNVGSDITNSTFYQIGLGAR